MLKDNIPNGSDVSAGTYKCNGCGYVRSQGSRTSLAPCPKKCGGNSWKALSGGDAAEDPYPNKK